MEKHKIHSLLAPHVLGTYSQAIQCGNIIYFSGQIPLDPKTMDIVNGNFSAQAKQAFANLREVCKAAKLTFENIVKITLYLTDLIHFPIVNEIMLDLFQEPFPARTTLQVSALPKGAQIEIDAIAVIEQ